MSKNPQPNIFLWFYNKNNWTS